MLEIAWDALAQEFASVAVGLCSPGSCMATGSSPTCPTSPRPIGFELALRGIRDLYGTAGKVVQHTGQELSAFVQAPEAACTRRGSRGLGGLSRPVQRP